MDSQQPQTTRPGCRRGAPPTVWTPEMDTVIRDMRAAGAKGSVIAMAVGIGSGRVFQRLTELGCHAPNTRRKRGLATGRRIGPGRRPLVQVDDTAERETLATLDALIAASPHRRPPPPEPPPPDPFDASVWERHHVRGEFVSDIARKLRKYPSEIFEALARHKRHLDAMALQRAFKAGSGTEAAWLKTRAMLNGVLEE